MINFGAPLSESYFIVTETFEPVSISTIGLAIPKSVLITTDVFRENESSIYAFVTISLLNMPVAQLTIFLPIALY